MTRSLYTSEVYKMRHSQHRISQYYSQSQWLQFSTTGSVIADLALLRAQVCVKTGGNHVTSTITPVCYIAFRLHFLFRFSYRIK